MTNFVGTDQVGEMKGNEIQQFLMLERGGGQRICLSCACYLINMAFANICRHAIHQIKAEYHRYLMLSVI